MCPCPGRNVGQSASLDSGTSVQSGKAYRGPWEDGDQQLTHNINMNRDLKCFNINSQY